MTTTTARQRATFLLEVALDQERLKERIAARLREERDRRRLSQMQMALELGISYRQYQRLENAQSMPRWRNLEDLADRLDLDLGELIADTSEAVTPVEEPAEGQDAALEEIRKGVAELLRRVGRLEEQQQPPAARPVRGRRRAGG